MYKPVILIGNGCRSNPRLVEHLCSLGVPVLTTWPAMDLVAENNPAFCGRPGTWGQRAANIIIQKADELWVFGARLDAETIGYNTNAFADHANAVNLFEVDPQEAKRFSDRDNFVIANPLRDLRLITPAQFVSIDASKEWLAWAKDLYRQFRKELDFGKPRRPGTPRSVQPFDFIRVLGDCCQEADIFAIGSSSTAPNTFHQTFKVKAGQRVTNLPTIGAMGADIPMALGAAMANPGRRVICVTGEGGFNLNLQELETIHRFDLPVLFFVYNNGGYYGIRAMQDNRFDGRRVGCDPWSGLTFPALGEIAKAFDMQYCLLDELDTLPVILKVIRSGIVEVMINPDWEPGPRVMSSLQGNTFKPDRFEDMTPKLPAGKLKMLMEWDG